MVDLLAFYGEGRRSMVKRWLRLGRFLPEEVAEFLADFEQLRPKFLYDNVYFCGTGASAQQRLGGRFGVAVLQILRGNPSEYKSGSWQEILCKPAKCVELWIKILYMRFGSVAKESPAPPGPFPGPPGCPRPARPSGVHSYSGSFRAVLSVVLNLSPSGLLGGRGAWKRRRGRHWLPRRARR